MVVRYLSEGGRVYDHVRCLSVDIGSRSIGSRGEKEAADYIYSYLKGLNLEVWKQTFDAETALLRDCRIEILEPPLGEITCAPILLTPDTPPEGVTGEIVFVEGSKRPSLGPHVRGKIMFWACSSREEFNWATAAKYQPLVVIAIWPGLGLKPKHYQMSPRMFHPYDPVTSFWITWEDGLRIFKAEAKKARVCLHSKHCTSTSVNIIAEVKGETYPNEIIVIGGHYDSPPGVPGAFDNASGVAMVMELARLYSQRGSKRTLRFVAFGGEEGGLLGSQRYVTQLKEQRGKGVDSLSDHLFCLNLDGLGIALGTNSCYVLGPPEIGDTVKTLGEELGIPHIVKEDIDFSDNLPFAWNGVPNISLTREGAGAEFIHTVEDTIELIDIEQLQQASQFIDALLAQTAARAELWPFKRQIPSKMLDKVRETQRKWELTQQKDQQGE